MPTARLTAARTVQPLDIPKIAAARGVEIPPPGVERFPPAEQVSLQTDGTEAELYLEGPPPESHEFGFEPFPIPPVERFDAPPESPPVPGSLFDPLSGVEAVGGQYVPRPTRPQPGAPPLPRAYQLVEREGKPAAGSIPGPLDILRPYLEPAPAMDEEGTVYLGFPQALRPYQREAVRVFLAHTGFLLADDPGTGKTVAACAALQTLFQIGQVRRVLIVCLEGGRRHWAQHLSDWAPGLLVTAVRGNPDVRLVDWRSPAHVYLTEYPTLGEDLESQALSGSFLEFDLVILDDAQALHRRARQPQLALDRLQAKRRWALAGSLPRQADEWLSIFSFLTPERTSGGADATLPALTRRFLPHTSRRSKAEVASQLPRWTRQEIWVELDARQRQSYDATLLEERRRLADLGGAITRSHIEAAIDGLKRACNFAPGSLDGAKVRPLINLVEDIVSAGGKIVLFSQYRQDGLDRLQRVLEAFGTVLLVSGADEETRGRSLRLFREDARRHVLLTDYDLRPEGGPLNEAAYMVHFDHGWNSAVRRRAELRLHPDPGPSTPTTVYEFWTADTIEERLHIMLAERAMLPDDLPVDIRPAHLEDRLDSDDWLQAILEVPSRPPEAALSVVPVPAARQPPSREMQREQMANLTPEGLLAGATQLMLVLGFPETQIVRGPEEGGGDLLAWRKGEGGEGRVLVRCVQAQKDVGVGEGRALLAALEARADCSAAYLVSTTDFTSSCNKLADESAGRLSLVSGAEFYRHLHILGAL
jgi:hypothetical protein